MKTLAEAMQMMGGVFLLAQMVILGLVLVLSILKFIQYFGKTPPEKLPFFKSHQFILFLGIFGFAWGMFTQLAGFIQALNAIIEAADVSPQLIIMGLKNSFVNPVIGLATGLLAALSWAILQGRYTYIQSR